MATFYSGFGSDSAGGSPSGLDTSTFGSGTATVRNDSTYVDGKKLELSTGSTVNYLAATPDTLGSTDDSDVVCQVLPSDTAIIGPAAGIEFDSQNNTDNAYIVWLEEIDSSTIEINFGFQQSNFDIQNLFTQQIPGDPSQVYNIRYSSEPTAEQKIKVWQAGSSEPNSFQITGLNLQNAPNGRAGAVIGSNGSSTLTGDVGRIGVGTNGDAAPKSAQASQSVTITPGVGRTWGYGVRDFQSKKDTFFSDFSTSEFPDNPAVTREEINQSNFTKFGDGTFDIVDSLQDFDGYGTLELDRSSYFQIFCPEDMLPGDTQQSLAQVDVSSTSLSGPVTRANDFGDTTAYITIINRPQNSDPEILFGRINLDEQSSTFLQSSTLSGDFSVPWNIRQESSGDTHRVRAWPKDQDEPTTWDITLTEPSYPVGRPGVGVVSNSSTGRFGVVSTGQNGVDAPTGSFIDVDQLSRSSARTFDVNLPSVTIRPADLRITLDSFSHDIPFANVSATQSVAVSDGTGTPTVEIDFSIWDDFNIQTKGQPPDSLVSMDGSNLTVERFLDRNFSGSGSVVTQDRSGSSQFGPIIHESFVNDVSANDVVSKDRNKSYAVVESVDIVSDGFNVGETRNYGPATRLKYQSGGGDWRGYTVVIDPSFTNVYFIRFDSGGVTERNPLAVDDSKIENGKRYGIELVSEGNTHTITITDLDDDEVISTSINDSSYAQGSPGLVYEQYGDDQRYQDRPLMYSEYAFDLDGTLEIFESGSLLADTATVLGKGLSISIPSVRVTVENIGDAKATGFSNSEVFVDWGIFENFNLLERGETSLDGFSTFGGGQFEAIDTIREGDTNSDGETVEAELSACGRAIEFNDSIGNTDPRGLINDGFLDDSGNIKYDLEDQVSSAQIFNYQPGEVTDVYDYGASGPITNLQKGPNGGWLGYFANSFQDAVNSNTQYVSLLKLNGKDSNGNTNEPDLLLEKDIGDIGPNAGNLTLSTGVNSDGNWEIEVELEDESDGFTYNFSSVETIAESIQGGVPAVGSVGYEHDTNRFENMRVSAGGRIGEFAQNANGLPLKSLNTGCARPRNITEVSAIPRSVTLPFAAISPQGVSVSADPLDGIKSKLEFDSTTNFNLLKRGESSIDGFTTFRQGSIKGIDGPDIGRPKENSNDTVGSQFSACGRAIEFSVNDLGFVAQSGIIDERFLEPSNSSGVVDLNSDKQRSYAELFNFPESGYEYGRDAAIGPSVATKKRDGTWGGYSAYITVSDDGNDSIVGITQRGGVGVSLASKKLDNISGFEDPVEEVVGLTLTKDGNDLTLEVENKDTGDTTTLSTSDSTYDGGVPATAIVDERVDDFFIDLESKTGVIGEVSYEPYDFPLTFDQTGCARPDTITTANADPQTVVLPNAYVFPDEGTADAQGLGSQLPNVYLFPATGVAGFDGQDATIKIPNLLNPQSGSVLLDPQPVTERITAVLDVDQTARSTTNTISPEIDTVAFVTLNPNQAFVRSDARPDIGIFQGKVISVDSVGSALGTGLDPSIQSDFQINLQPGVGVSTGDGLPAQFALGQILTPTTGAANGVGLDAEPGYGYVISVDQKDVVNADSFTPEVIAEIPVDVSPGIDVIDSKTEPVEVVRTINNFVFVGTDDGDVTAFNSDSGGRVWKYDASDSINRSSMTVSDGLVYGTSFGGDIFAIDAETGVEQWSYSSGGTPAASATVVDGTVYATTAVFAPDTDNVFALNASDGSVQWTASAGAILRSSPNVVGGSVYVSGTGGSLYSLNDENGNVEWEFETGERVGGSPTRYRGNVYVANDNGDVFGISAQSGKELWSTNLATKVDDSSLTVAGNKIYVPTYSDNGDGTSTGKVVVLDGVDGSVLWEKNPTDQGVPYSVTVGSDTMYYISTTTGSSDDVILHAVDINDQTEKWTYTVPSTETASSPTVGTKKVYFGANDKVYGIDTANGTEKLLTDSVISGVIDGSSPTLIRESDGDSIDTRVRQGTLGHTDRWAETAFSFEDGAMGLIFVKVGYTGEESFSTGALSITIRNTDSGGVIYSDDVPVTYEPGDERVYMVSQTVDPGETLSNDLIEVEADVASIDSDPYAQFRFSYGANLQSEHIHELEPGVIERFSSERLDFIPDEYFNDNGRLHPQNVTVKVNGNPVETFAGEAQDYDRVIDVRGEMQQGSINEVVIQTESVGHIQAWVEGDVYRKIEGGG